MPLQGFTSQLLLKKTSRAPLGSALLQRKGTDLRQTASQMLSAMVSEGLVDARTAEFGLYRLTCGASSVLLEWRVLVPVLTGQIHRHEAFDAAKVSYC